MTATSTETTTEGAFPSGFLWGTATASYQIEGAVHEGGRGESIWDRFSHTPGRTHDGDTGDVACDHYHRYREDVAVMSELGLNAYRFSLAWPRLQPEGRGPLSNEGVAFYDRLVDELLGAGIRPWVTLYHWDLPQALEELGGWPARDTAFRFADYAAEIHDRLADRVADWTTLNEPWCSAFLGYGSGIHAPGRSEPGAAVAAAHHLLLGHGTAVAAMRSARPDHRFGITLNLYPVTTISEDADDLDAVRRVDGMHNRLFLDPVLRGEYPDDVLADLAPTGGVAAITAEDPATIGVPIDVLGVNYYSRHVVQAARPGRSGEGAHSEPAWIDGGDVEKLDTGRPKTRMGWEIDASGLYDVLRRVTDDYDAPPLYVTENGAAFADEVSADGQVHDPDRVRYLDEHFRAAKQAIDAGVDLRGYFVWSLLDNFEWSWGYDRRFGIVRVDFDTQQRTVKDSGRWLAGVARANALSVG
jgi:beta-glucosidase